MNEWNDVERVRMSAMFADIVTLIRSNDPKKLEELRPIIPLYQLRINYRLDGAKSCGCVIRTFTYINRKKKGKKRIYISVNGPTKLYMLFISKNRIQKLCHGDQIAEKWAADLIGDRWFVVSESYKFQNVFQLLNHTVAMEKETARQNHPPAGRSTDVWLHAEALIGLVSQYRSIKSDRHVYEVELNAYEFH